MKNGGGKGLSLDAGTKACGTAQPTSAIITLRSAFAIGSSQLRSVNLTRSPVLSPPKSVISTVGFSSYGIVLTAQVIPCTTHHPPQSTSRHPLKTFACLPPLPSEIVRQPFLRVTSSQRLRVKRVWNMHVRISHVWPYHRRSSHTQFRRLGSTKLTLTTTTCFISRR